MFCVVLDEPFFNSIFPIRKADRVQIDGPFLDDLFSLITHKFIFLSGYFLILINRI
ncbi:hypothetical protein LEP1GSC029_3107 [Leptospira interrogans str. 2002000626]|uniref:Uncharacterized protein n=1 Tax=Leptospira interrogans str. 2002000626 TaxID=996803 RepID=A0A829D2H1_LEPIR|nr:hypothetical protein LEP1GSC029_3107 [Leptospira interrogans str. 2002000626]